MATTLFSCLTEADITKLYEAAVSPPDSNAVEARVDAHRDASATDLPAPDLPADGAGGDLADAGPGPLVGGARLLYGEGGVELLQRVWSPALGWTGPSPVVPVTGTVGWSLSLVSPTVAGDEAALLFEHASASTQLSMLTRTPVAGWSSAWSTTAINVAEYNKRGFDLAYEDSSGDLLVVYSNGTHTPRFRTRTAGGSFSDEQALPINDGPGLPKPDLNDGRVLWVELVPRPGSDEVALLYADAAADLVAVIWDGSKWKTASAEVLELDLLQNPISNSVHQRCFDGAYEGHGGDLLVAWGSESGTGYFSRSRSAATGAWSAPWHFDATSGRVDFLDLEGQVGNDLIAGAFLDQGRGTERLFLGVWDGTQWADVAEYDSQVRDVDDTAHGDFPAAAAWLDGTTAVVVYADDDANALDWATWRQGATTGWQVEPDALVQNKGATESVLLARIPGTNELMVVYSDSNRQLGWGVFDGTSWALSQPLSLGVAALDSMPFSLAFGP